MAIRRSRVREAFIRTSWALLDGSFWAFAVVFTVWLRYQYDTVQAFTMDTWAAAGIAFSLHILAGLFFGPYLVTHVRGSFEEVVAVARAVLIAGLGLLAYAAAFSEASLPRSIPALAGATALTAMLAARLVLRSWRSNRASRKQADSRVIVFGAGIAGKRLVHNLTFDESSFRPVALVDDDKGKRKVKYDGVRVRGDRHQIPRIATKYEATHLVVAIPSADAALMRDARDIADECGLKLKVLPAIDQILHGDPRATDLRDIDLEDVLGRRPVQLDQEAIHGQLNGRVVLVTGAGGSIGAELCRQIAKFSPSRLILLERDESALHTTQLALTGRGLHEGDDLMLADIRDLATMRRLFQKARPDVVFHAAALKHLSLLEKYPLEAWQTNVLGTLNVLTASAESGVGTFVNISTDKAAAPTSVLGYSKRIAERFTADFARTQPGRYVSVRFGNVLGSRGSVIPAFTEQIRQGGPVTVTHPDVERYFMLIPEACQLVMQAASMGRDGEVMVLDMGSPVKIAEVAQTLIGISGKHHVSIVYTGLRAGEKLSEDLFTPGEQRHPTEHPLVSAVHVPPLSPDNLQQPQADDSQSTIRWLAERATREQVVH